MSGLPIRVRLAAWYALLLAATILALSTFLVLQLRTDLRRAVDEDARIGSSELVRAVSMDAIEDQSGPDQANDVVEDFQETAQAVLPSSDDGAQLLDGTGQVLAHHGPVAGTEPMLGEWARAVASSPRTLTVNLGAERQPYRVQVTAFSADGEPRVLLVAESLQLVEEAVAKVVVLLLVGGPAALVLTAIAAYWLVRRALRPVERIIAGARQIGIEQLQERVEVPWADDETGRLATTINAMLGRIEEGMHEKRRLVADASHELRTPLTVMRTELDVTLRSEQLPDSAREVLHSTREEVDRMSRIVDNLLTLAQVDEGRLELLTVPVDLRELAQDAGRSLEVLAADKGVTVVVDGPAVRVQVDPARLRLVLTNLIENAIKFSPQGGAVRVSTWTGDAGIGATVSDEGPGIPPEDVKHLFDRFFRVDSARGRAVEGSGLGLAICREVAHAHDGQLRVDTEPGHGSSFTLTLPTWRAAE